MLVRPDNVMEQVQLLIDRELVVRRITMSRCSLCNTLLRVACDEEIAGADYAPRDRTGFLFCWCNHCRKLYWNGSHGRNIGDRIDRELRGR